MSALDELIKKAEEVFGGEETFLLDPAIADLAQLRKENERLVALLDEATRLLAKERGMNGTR